MNALIGLVALLFTTSAFAQVAPPKAAKRPPVQVRPQAPLGCNYELARSEAQRSGRANASVRRLPRQKPRVPRPRHRPEQLRCPSREQ